MLHRFGRAVLRACLGCGVSIAMLPPLAAASAPTIVTATPNLLRVPTASRGATPAALTLEIVTATGPLMLELTPNANLQREATRWIPAVRAGDTQFYTGRVVGEPHSWARLTRIGTRWTGAVQTAQELWFIDPADQHPALAQRVGAHDANALVFRASDILGIGAIDLGGVEPPPGSSLSATSGHAAGSTTSGPVALGVTLVLDTEFQQHFGTSAASMAAAALNVADGFYFAQLDTHLNLFALRALTSNGTLTSSDPNALLEAFAAYSQAGLSFSGLAHLLSGKNFTGSTIGLAYRGNPQPGWVSTLCNPKYGTGVDQATFSSAYNGSLLAHEMGHNFGAEHDGTDNTCPASGFIMEPMLTGAKTFSTCSLDYFAAYRAFAQPSCLLPVDAIFADGFE